MPARSGLRQLAWLVLFLLWLAPPPATAQHRFQVLLLFDEDNDLPGLATINRNLRQSLRAAFGDVSGAEAASRSGTRWAACRHSLKPGALPHRILSTSIRSLP